MSGHIRKGIAFTVVSLHPIPEIRDQPILRKNHGRIPVSQLANVTSVAWSS